MMRCSIKKIYIERHERCTTRKAQKEKDYLEGFLNFALMQGW